MRQIFIFLSFEIRIGARQGAPVRLMAEAESQAEAAQMVADEGSGRREVVFERMATPAEIEFYDPDPGEVVPHNDQP